MRKYYRNLPEFSTRPVSTNAVDDDFDEVVRTELDRIVDARKKYGVKAYLVHYTGGTVNDREWLRREQIDPERFDDLLEDYESKKLARTRAKKKRKVQSGSNDPSFSRQRR